MDAWRFSMTAHFFSTSLFIRPAYPPTCSALRNNIYILSMGRPQEWEAVDGYGNNQITLSDLKGVYWETYNIEISTGSYSCSFEFSIDFLFLTSVSSLLFEFTPRHLLFIKLNFSKYNIVCEEKSFWCILKCYHR